MKQLFVDISWNEEGPFCYFFPCKFLSVGRKNDCLASWWLVLSVCLEAQLWSTSLNQSHVFSVHLSVWFM